MIVAFLVSATEAQTRNASGGGLSSNRGISSAESLAISAVLKETAGGRAATDGTAPAPRSGRYSPDYYRAYSQRHQMAAGTRRVATAPPPPAKPKAARLAPRVAAAAPTPMKPVPAKPGRVAVAPRAAVIPPAPVKPVPPKPIRVAVAPRVAMAPVPPPKPVPVKPMRVVLAPRGPKVRPAPVASPIIKPKRVAMVPRVAVAPRAPAIPNAKSKRAKYSQDTATQTETPTRVLFR